MEVVVKTRTWFLVAELWQSSLSLLQQVQKQSRVLKTLAHRVGNLYRFCNYMQQFLLLTYCHLFHSCPQATFAASFFLFIVVAFWFWVFLVFCSGAIMFSLHLLSAFWVLVLPRPSVGISISGWLLALCKLWACAESVCRGFKVLLFCF